MCFLHSSPLPPSPFQQSLVTVAERLPELRNIRLLKVASQEDKAARVVNRGHSLDTLLNWHAQLLLDASKQIALMSHWLELGHMTTASCSGNWEIEYLIFSSLNGRPARKKEIGNGY